jgi:hypothetical protein
MSVSGPPHSIELEPTVKAWLDTVIVPALVREFLTTRKEASHVLSETSKDVVAYATGANATEDKP